MGAVTTDWVPTRFNPARHALPFPNQFPRGTPVVNLWTPLGRVRIGDAHYGLCGGMVFTALDCFLWCVEPPRQPTPGVVRYLARRLLASWGFPFGVGKYLAWQSRPQIVLTRLTWEQEWPVIRANLTAGMPVPLGVVKVWSSSPRRLAENHQVLAWGFTEHADATEIAVYDPNFPADLDTTITLPANANTACVHSCEGATVRGLFAVPYMRPDNPPMF